MSKRQLRHLIWSGNEAAPPCEHCKDHPSEFYLSTHDSLGQPHSDGYLCSQCYIEVVMMACYRAGIVSITLSDEGWNFVKLAEYPFVTWADSVLKRRSDDN